MMAVTVGWSDERKSATDYAGDERKAATDYAVPGMAITVGWTGEKKTKIQHTPTSGNFVKVVKDDNGQSSGKVVLEQEEGPELLEGLDWGPDELDEKIDCFVKQLNRKLPDNDDDDFWIHYDDKERQELNERLALTESELMRYSLIIKASDVARSYRFIFLWILV